MPFRPSPTPGLPGWEVMKEPRTDSSGGSDMELDQIRASPAVQPPSTQKRKVADGKGEPQAKRPRHEVLVRNAVPSSRPSSSMLPPPAPKDRPLPSRMNLSLPLASQPPPSTAPPSLPSRAPRPSASHHTALPSASSPHISTKNASKPALPSSQPRPPRQEPVEIIEISDDDDSPPPARAKGKAPIRVRTQARKSAGRFAPRPRVSTAHEVIELTDSSDDDVRPPPHSASPSTSKSKPNSAATSSSVLSGSPSDVGQTSSAGPSTQPVAGSARAIPLVKPSSKAQRRLSGDVALDPPVPVRTAPPARPATAASLRFTPEPDDPVQMQTDPRPPRKYILPPPSLRASVSNAATTSKVTSESSPSSGHPQPSSFPQSPLKPTRPSTLRTPASVVNPSSSSASTSTLPSTSATTKTKTGTGINRTLSAMFAARKPASVDAMDVDIPPASALGASVSKGKGKAVLPPADQSESGLDAASALNPPPIPDPQATLDPMARRAKTPERSAQDRPTTPKQTVVKVQVISPHLPLKKKKARKTTGGSASGGWNPIAHKALLDKGNSARDAIDLTSDNEDGIGVAANGTANANTTTVSESPNATTVWPSTSTSAVKERPKEVLERSQVVVDRAKTGGFSSSSQDEDQGSAWEARQSTSAYTPPGPAPASASGLPSSTLTSTSASTLASTSTLAPPPAPPSPPTPHLTLRSPSRESTDELALRPGYADLDARLDEDSHLDEEEEEEGEEEEEEEGGDEDDGERADGPPDTPPPPSSSGQTEVGLGSSVVVVGEDRERGVSVPLAVGFEERREVDGVGSTDSAHISTSTLHAASSSSTTTPKRLPSQLQSELRSPTRPKPRSKIAVSMPELPVVSRSVAGGGEAPMTMTMMTIQPVSAAASLSTLASLPASKSLSATRGEMRSAERRSDSVSPSGSASRSASASASSSQSESKSGSPVGDSQRTVVAADASGAGAGAAMDVDEDGDEDVDVDGDVDMDDASASNAANDVSASANASVNEQSMRLAPQDDDDGEEEEEEDDEEDEEEAVAEIQALVEDTLTMDDCGGAGDEEGIPEVDIDDEEDEDLVTEVHTSEEDEDGIPEEGLPQTDEVGPQQEDVPQADEGDFSARRSIYSSRDSVDASSSRSSLPPSRRTSSRLSRASASDLDADTSAFDRERRWPSPSVQSISAPASPSRSSSPDEPEAARPLTFRTLGGLPVVRFEDHRRHFQPPVRLSADLPSRLQDNMNRAADALAACRGSQFIFEAMMRENSEAEQSSLDNPIRIYNDVDADATPPWEFHYTNEMWHGPGVPPPDRKSLKGCDCKGGCNPKSRSCACLKKQRTALDDASAEFAYDKQGKLKLHPNEPIYECNDLCGCDETCRNRVVQKGRTATVNIRKTQTKGWGVFNGPRKILKGSFIGIYSGELITHEEAASRAQVYDQCGRTYLFDLDFHFCSQKDNKYYVVDAFHAGNFTRFLNNSCDPNCRLFGCYINEGNIRKPLLVFFSIRDIDPEEEICFNYKGKYPGEEYLDDDEDSQDGDDDDGSSDVDVGKKTVDMKCSCGSKRCKGDMF